MRFLALIAAMLPIAVSAAECRARSGDSTAALVELYTSEGCSSCPPADRWLATLGDVRGVVPIAFHVHYWDYIGWKDVFADPRYTERQRTFAKAAGANMIYTPQVMVGGRDFRGWSGSSEAKAAFARINAAPARASIEVVSRVVPGEGVRGVATAHLLPGWKPDDFALFVALTQNGLASRPTAGENKGEKLAHSFAARDLSVVRAQPSTSPASFHAAFDFKAKSDWDFTRLALVAFVQNVKTGQVLQALSAPCR